MLYCGMPDETTLVDDITPRKRRAKQYRRRPLTERQRIIAKLHVQGATLQEIGDRLLTRTGGPVQRQDVWKTLQREDVQEYCLLLSGKLEEQLEDLEREAVPIARDLLHDPDPDIRYRTYTDLLNRMGKRGKPLEKSESQSLNLEGDAVQAALLTALRDPGVRAWLTANPNIKEQIDGLSGLSHAKLSKVESGETGGAVRQLLPSSIASSETGTLSQEGASMVEEEPHSGAGHTA